MALCTLLRFPTSPAAVRGWAWEHAMAHRTLYGGMQNLTKLSVLPYQIDPMEFGNPKYQMNHQQAHTDAMANLPRYPYSLVTNAPAAYPLDETGIPSAQNLYDTRGNTRWWTFVNHMEHMIAQATVPLKTGPYPYW